MRELEAAMAGEDHLAIRARDRGARRRDQAVRAGAHEPRGRRAASAARRSKRPRHACRTPLRTSTAPVRAEGSLMPKITFKNPHGPEVAGPLTVECKRGLTILDAAEECGARVGHACGGNLACSTCHVYVEEGLDSLARDRRQGERHHGQGVRRAARVAPRLPGQARRRGRRRRDQRESRYARGSTRIPTSARSSPRAAST